MEERRATKRISLKIIGEARDAMQSPTSRRRGYALLIYVHIHIYVYMYVYTHVHTYIFYPLGALLTSDAISRPWCTKSN
jgi:hypothetical protein